MNRLGGLVIIVALWLACSGGVNNNSPSVHTRIGQVIESRTEAVHELANKSPFPGVDNCLNCLEDWEETGVIQRVWSTVDKLWPIDSILCTRETGTPTQPWAAGYWVHGIVRVGNNMTAFKVGLQISGAEVMIRTEKRESDEVKTILRNINDAIAQMDSVSADYSRLIHDACCNFVSVRQNGQLHARPLLTSDVTNDSLATYIYLALDVR